MKTAVIDGGGGMRGMYAAGVLDACLEQNIHFDFGIGVSAGSANIASYIAGQEGRNYMFYREYSRRPEYMSIENFMQSKSFINMDYIYSTLSNTDGEYPLDYQAIKDSPTQLYVVATNAITGNAAYFDRKWLAENSYDIFKASCSIPIVNKPYWIAGVPFYDGALADPVPLAKALDLGADKVVIILTKPIEGPRKAGKDRALAAFMKQYPKAAEKLRTRAERWNEDVEWARELEKQGKVLLVTPDDTCGVDTLDRDPKSLHRLYLKGFLDGLKIKEFLKAPIADENEPADHN